jgi:hypothetical protein
MHSASLYSLSPSPPTVALSPSLCCFHLRLLLFHFLFVAFISNCSSFALSLPNDFLSLSLSSPTVALSLSSLSNAFGFSVLSSCSFSLWRSTPTAALSVSSDTGLAFSSSLSPPTVALSLSLCRFHIQLLFISFIAFKCIRLFLSFTSDCCSLPLSSQTVVLSRYRFQMHSSLSPPTIALSLSLCRFRLYGGIGAGVRRNAFGFLAPSPLLYFSWSQRSLLIMSPSLCTEWRL